jgi:hypothetical protein
MNDLNQKDRGIYGCVDEENELMYIGSTEKTLSELEYNHRNWRKRKFKYTFFRGNLEEKGQGWKFVWLQEPKLYSKPLIEIEEGALIRMFTPKYNEDIDPYESSVCYGRYERLY